MLKTNSTLVSGLPGSGKSYLAVKLISDRCISSVDITNYPDFLYTNIADFDHDLLVSRSKKAYSKLNLDVKLKSFDLDIDLLYKHLSEMKSIRFDSKKNKEEAESEMIIYAKKHKLYNCMIIIDEFHHYFIKPDSVWSFLITYRRHFNCELILITQAYNQIHQTYTTHEVYIVAHRRAHAISNNLNYSEVTFLPRDGNIDWKRNPGTRFSLSPDPKIFELYSSGGSVGVKRGIYKYFKYVFVFVVLFIILMFYFVKTVFSDPISASKSASKQVQKKIEKHIEKHIENK